jgi:hypothetical protein
MRTTVELPDDLLIQAKSAAALEGISLRQFFLQAIQYKLTPEKRKVRRPPPAIGDTSAPSMTPLTRGQIDEAMFG